MNEIENIPIDEMIDYLMSNYPEDVIEAVLNEFPDKINTGIIKSFFKLIYYGDAKRHFLKLKRLK